MCKTVLDELFDGYRNCEGSLSESTKILVAPYKTMVETICDNSIEKDMLEDNAFDQRIMHNLEDEDEAENTEASTTEADNNALTAHLVESVSSLLLNRQQGDPSSSSSLSTSSLLTDALTDTEHSEESGLQLPSNNDEENSVVSSNEDDDNVLQKEITEDIDAHLAKATGVGADLKVVAPADGGGSEDDDRARKKEREERGFIMAPLVNSLNLQ